MSRKENDFDSFIEATNRDFASALAEIRAGRKSTHWIWYIFPQLEFLGQSGSAVHFGIKTVNEAVVFLNDGVLGPRLLEISAAARDKLRAGIGVKSLMGSSVDAFKLRSCATLFYYATTVSSQEHNSLFKEIADIC
ncbi:unnamed protein product, partial [Ectocarpus fasciculatus]